MMYPLAVDHHSQLKSPGRQRKPGLEAVDISGDRAPARLCGDQSFDPSPLTEGDFDRIKAAQASEQLEQKKRRIRAEFKGQRAPQAGANLADQFAHEAFGALGVVDVAGTVLEAEDLPGLRQVSEQRIVTGVLAVMRVKAACGPSHLTTGTDDGAIKVDSQTPQTEPGDLLIEQFAVKPHQRAQRALSKLLEPVNYCA